MIAIDTNVVLRLILDDDHAQTATIRTLMARTPVFVTLTVLLETGWVLESRYGLSRSVAADALEGLAALEGVVIARLSVVSWALGRYRAGADLADVIHLAAAAKLGGFATLDRRIARRADVACPVPIQTLI